MTYEERAELIATVRARNFAERVETEVYISMSGLPREAALLELGVLPGKSRRKARRRSRTYLPRR